MMRNNQLTLVPPVRWFDRTDAAGLVQWGEKVGGGKGEAEVYALCLAEGTEQAHHWQLFAGHSHGVCVHFDRAALIAHLDTFGAKILHGPVIYKTLTELREMEFKLDQLPFLKRSSFEAEQEYRVVAWYRYDLSDDTYRLPMPASLINRVVLGPGIPRQLVNTLKDVACGQPGCSEISFKPSGIHNNASWNGALRVALSKIKVT
jgi:hypothetical protein